MNAGQGAVVVEFSQMVDRADPNILVVDDDPGIHKILTAVLGSNQWQIESAYNGLEGLDRIRARTYDLVITDLRMPGMDGLELLHSIRQIRPNTKVMVMTGESTPDHIIRSIREQAFSYFSKPFSAGAVVDMIAHALKTPAWQDDIEVQSARPEWIALSVRCKVDLADRVVQFMRELKMDLPAEERDQIATAFREMLLNAIEHGGHCDPQKKLYVAYVRTTRALLYYIRDPGKGFSMAAIPHAAVSNAPGGPVAHMAVRQEQGIRPGGFGILLVRKLVDELIYNETGNEVLLIKYLK